METNIELLNLFVKQNSSFMENPISSIQNTLFSNDNFLAQEPEFPVNFVNNLPGFFCLNDSNAVPVAHSLPSVPEIPSHVHQKFKKRKESLASDSSSENSSIPVLEDGFYGNTRTTKRRSNTKRGKREKDKEKDEEKPKEVSRVRARRGQASDSHSLAERARREKINEKFRCLQDIVPGCYKTMGKAVMLDQFIQYVQSLQNQVEFLSMKLAAASSFYDFNSDTDVRQTMQGTNAYEAQEMERLVRESGYGGLSCFPSTWPL